ncbi:hypothetical protein ACMFMF_011916 [Clarireedia jacksonii]
MLAPLHPEIPSPLPPRPARLDPPLLIHLLPKRHQIQLSPPLIDINRVKINTPRPLLVINLIAHKEQDYNGSRKVRLKESLCIWLPSNGKQRHVELSHETEEDKEEANPRTDDAEHSRERQVICRAAFHLPDFAEPDMRVADGSPGEEVGETREGKKPREDFTSLGGLVDVGEETKGQSDGERNQWATMFIDVRAPGWTHALGAESLHGAGGSESAGVGDGDDGDGDDGVEDRGEDFDACETEGQHEGRVGCVATGRVGEGFVVGGDNKTKDEERKDVEEGDSPENLFSCFGNAFAWIGGFG